MGLPHNDFFYYLYLSLLPNLPTSSYPPHAPPTVLCWQAEMQYSGINQSVVQRGSSGRRSERTSSPLTAARQESRSASHSAWGASTPTELLAREEITKPKRYRTKTVRKFPRYCPLLARKVHDTHSADSCLSFVLC